MTEKCKSENGNVVLYLADDDRHERPVTEAEIEAAELFPVRPERLRALTVPLPFRRIKWRTRWRW